MTALKFERNDDVLTVKCRACESSLDPEARFCKYCGTRVGVEDGLRAMPPFKPTSVATVSSIFTIWLQNRALRTGATIIGSCYAIISLALLARPETRVSGVAVIALGLAIAAAVVAFARPGPIRKTASTIAGIAGVVFVLCLSIGTTNGTASFSAAPSQGVIVTDEPGAAANPTNAPATPEHIAENPKSRIRTPGASHEFSASHLRDLIANGNSLYEDAMVFANETPDTNDEAASMVGSQVNQWYDRDRKFQAAFGVGDFRKYPASAQPAYLELVDVDAFLYAGVVAVVGSCNESDARLNLKVARAILDRSEHLLNNPNDDSDWEPPDITQEETGNSKCEH